LQKQGELLEQLSGELRGNVVLMYFEKDYRYCHRVAVVDALSGMLDLTPAHLEVKHQGPANARWYSVPGISVWSKCDENGCRTD